MVRVFASALAAAVLGSCGYSASFHDCTISCTETCPDNYSCGTEGLCRAPGMSGTTCAEALGDAGNGMEAGATDAGPDAPPDAMCPNDLDCDGILDSNDNCPTIPNVNQANEDGDKFGDACDPCPPVADDNPPDGDGDGVADACDPNPATAGDKITLFEGFHSNAIPAGWSASVPWQFDGSNATVTTGATVASLTTAAPSSGHETVSASFKVGEAAADGDDIGIVDDQSAGTDNGVSCRLDFALIGSQHAFLWLSFDAATGMPSYEMISGKTYVMRETRGANNAFACDISRADMPATHASTSGTSAIDNASPQVGLRVVNTSATYQWLMVVSSP